MHCHLGLLQHQILLLVGLDGDCVLCLLVGCPPNDCKCALADLKTDLELAELEWLLLCILRPTTIDQIAEVS